jgi:tRNA modification GTPase
MKMDDTILALATPEGSGAIGVIRLSGSKAIEIVDSVFNSKNRLIIEKSHSQIFGTIINGDQVIDEVLVSIFRNPKSYTGEDTVEISCHGSRFILQSIMDLLSQKGIRLATAGEFTQRAFLNGKLDLAQAEAVADLIASESSASHRIALNQMRGGISNELSILRDELIHFTALIELELDFGEEDVEFADRAQLTNLISVLKNRISELIATFHYGNAIKNGVPVAIVGKPNAGKSSLLNSLLKEDRAIVSSVAGTTRDTLEETINLDGIIFRFIDTAGLRDTDDEIEKMGIRRAYEKIDSARIVIYLFDKNDTTIKEVQADIESIPKDKIIFICPSKIDKYQGIYWKEWDEGTNVENRFCFLAISTKEASDSSIKNLQNKLVESIKGGIEENQVIISNSRHLDSLNKALKAIEETETAINQNISGDLLSPHLRDALRHIGSITGAIEVDRDILGAVFSRFCIGK